MIIDHDQPPFAPGEVLVLIDERNRAGLLTVPQPEETVRFHGEDLPCEMLCQLREGQLIPVNKHRYLVMRPTMEQIIMNMPREAQVIYPKDLGMLLVWGDVAPGLRVLEVGAGHGALTMTLLRALGPEGRLVSYDIRQDHLNRTGKNIAAYLGQTVLERWEPILADPAQEGFAQQAWDRLFTDVPEPWEMVLAARQALRPGGVWTAWVPTVPQMANLMEAVFEDPYFCLPVCYETMQRYWHVRKPSVRPAHEMKAHTGFVVCCRRRWRGDWRQEPEA